MKPIPSHPKDLHRFFMRWSGTQKLLFGALMAALAAILQSAGGLLPGVGFLISPFTTAPILLVALVSLRTSVLSYFLTILLLLFIEPTELFIFPFTTGLLGFGLGFAFHFLNRRLEILIANGVLLTIGICIPLYGLGFPVFGPALSSFNLSALAIIFGFSFFYSLIWLEFSFYFLNKIKRILGV
ncbi:hypothetical protein [Sporosarcina ureilytica]|nr:hypothetical protein [Sporosarcina ureilytica]